MLCFIAILQFVTFIPVYNDLDDTIAIQVIAFSWIFFDKKDQRG